MSGSDGEAPLAFHVMAKPTGARCNLACAYCFFLRNTAGSCRGRLFPRPAD